MQHLATKISNFLLAIALILGFSLTAFAQPQINNPIDLKSIDSWMVYYNNNPNNRNLVLIKSYYIPADGELEQLFAKGLNLKTIAKFASSNDGICIGCAG